MTVTGETVAAFLGQGDDTALVALAGQSVPIVAAMARAYTRDQGFTGADLGDVVRRAGLLALRGDIASPAVGRSQFEQALRESRPSVTPEMEQEYEQLRRSLKQQGPLVQRPRIGFQLD